MTQPALSVDHVALRIYDAEATHRFYSDVLGLTLVGALSGPDWEGKPWLMMMYEIADGRQLVLCALRGSKRPAVRDDVTHYALSVATRADQEAWCQRLELKGVPFREEDHGAQKSIYFEDPNGITLEITTPDSHRATLPDAGAQQLVRRWIAEDAPTK